MADFLGGATSIFWGVWHFLTGWVGKAAIQSEFFWIKMISNPVLVLAFMPAIMTLLVKARSDKDKTSGCEGILWLYIHIYTLSAMLLSAFISIFAIMISKRALGSTALNVIEAHFIIKVVCMVVLGAMLLNGHFVNKKNVDRYCDFTDHESFPGVPKCSLTYARIAFLSISVLYTLHETKKDFDKEITRIEAQKHNGSN